MSEKKEYVKLWLSYQTYFQSYTPEEVGRLVLAMLAYKDTGETPVFQGNERFIWPAIQRDIDEARAAQEAAAQTSRENGKNGGRPRKNPPALSAEENPAGFSETQKTTRTKDKDIDKVTVIVKDKDRDESQIAACGREKMAAADRLLAQIISEAKAEARKHEREAETLF